MADEATTGGSAEGPEGEAQQQDSWNYFNYFTEIEEYFWKKRGAHLLVSPLDWAIMETWQKAGVPLEAVLKGIDRASESYARSRRAAGRAMKTLAYCTDAVLDAAEEMQEAAAGAAPKRGNKPTGPAFPAEELRAYLVKNAAQTRKAAARLSGEHAGLAARLCEIADAAASVCGILDAPGFADLEHLERRLTVLDDKVYAAVTADASEELQLKIRREMDGQLAMYRRKMKAEQLALVERQYLQKRLLEEFALVRFSLFYFT
ncbi:MAG: hypothetical protein ABSG16_07680 [Candidatus Acidiferrum sp.]|jgi:hypothetical protein